MIAVLRNLRNWNWWGQSAAASRLRTRAAWISIEQRVKKFFAGTNGQAFVCSVVIHVVLLIIAAMSVFQMPSDRLPGLVISVADAEPSDIGTDSATTISFELAGDEPPAGGGSFGSPLADLPIEPNIAAPVGSLSTLLESDDSVTHSDLSKVVGSPAALHGPGIGRGKGVGIGDGQGSGIGKGAGTGKQFFGRGGDGKRIVYVLDCSLSMNHPHGSDAKTRFNRMKLELMNSVSNLKPEQEFFIVFFNHEAIPMPADHPVAAAVENQQQFLAWAREVPAIGDTDPTAALAIALRMQPDVIYFLTDGSFSQPANEVVDSIQQSQSIIHTFSFAPNLTDKQADGLELMRKGKMSAARLKLGENTYRRVREVFSGEKVLKNLSERNQGQFHVIP